MLDFFLFFLEVEYVKDSAKTLYLLECLKKTAPPVLIFASNQGDVDDVLEYLFIKGVMARAIHGNKDQTDRKEAIREFKAQRVSLCLLFQSVFLHLKPQ